MIKLARISKAIVTVLTFIVGAYLIYHLVVRYLPDQFNPLVPVVISEEPNFMTALKIELLKYNSDVCFSVLKKSDLVFERVADHDTGEGCGFYNVAKVKPSNVSYGSDISLSCAATVGLAIWQKHDLQPQALKTFGQAITRVRHYGTYACRNVNNSSNGRRSQHAFANAIDISGFELADGTNISVLADWGKNTNKGKFLEAIHDLACQRFSTVLGPNYNNLHRDHFHFDQGSTSICR